MSEQPRDPGDGQQQDRRPRDHLQVVTDPAAADGLRAAAGRPRSIGRLIAQTALIADGAVQRRREQAPSLHGRGMGRLLGRFR